MSATGAMAEITPLRYRGYYYDAETGFYYLQSRYYDPNTGRFINADGYASTGQGLMGYNMFAYCNNNSVNSADPAGYAAWGTNMVSICDGGSSKFIYNQNSEPYASMPFGLATVGHGGCGPVSVYNAMQILGRYDVEFEDVLEYYDENGGEVLFGWLGSLPHTAIQYFLDQGYKVAVLKGNEVFYGGGMSECFDASIVWY